MEKPKKELQIRQAFEMAQKGHQNFAKLAARLKQTYNQLQEEDKRGFQEEFVNLLKYPMIVYRREPAVERLIEFVAKFTISLEQVDEENDDQEESPFMSFIFNFLLESHEACSHSVRFRACQLINKLLGSMAENAQIDDELYDRIYEVMLIRLKDKFPNVRIQAVLAMARLQDPSDNDCPVINAYMHLIECDPNLEVRRAVLSCIGPSVKTLPKIIGRTMDVKEKVRKLAYQILAEKIHIKAFSISQRVKLLEQGLNDRSDAVKEIVQKTLLQAWLRSLEGNVLDLLHRLDVENCVEVGVSALNAIFALSSIKDLAESCYNLEDRRVISAENLTCENALYWRCLCQFMKTKGDEGEEALEKLLPETAIYAAYLLRYLKNLPVPTESQRVDFERIEELMKNDFISQQLIILVDCLDTSEEGGRKWLLSVLQEILVLQNTPNSLVALLVEQLLLIQKDEDRRIQLVAEIISDVREPIISVELPIDADEQRKRQVKLADAKVQLIEAKQALEESIACQDFGHASELKEKIEELENRKMELVKEAEQPEIKEVRMEKDDPETILKCLTICCGLLKQMAITKGINSTLNGIAESLILPGITNINPAVRNMAVLSLGSSALQNKEFAIQHLPLLLQIAQLDEAKVKISALEAVFDILLVYGIEAFNSRNDKLQVTPSEELENENEKPEAGEGVEESKEPEVETDTVNSILTLLTGYLGSEIADLRTVAAEGLAKILFAGRLVSPKLLSRLILLWYNPVTEEDTRLRHCLGVFFPLYAYANRTNQEYFLEAFLPTLKTLFYAPASSPLADINVSNVAELLVDLMRSNPVNSQGEQIQDYQEFTIHDSLAVKICVEVMKDPNSPDIRTLVKTLNCLDLSVGTSPSTQHLRVLLDQMIEEIKDKVSQRAVEKVKDHLNEGSRDMEKSKCDTAVKQTHHDDEAEENSQIAQNSDVSEVQSNETGKGKGARGLSKSTKKGQDKPSTTKTVTKSRRTRKAAGSLDDSDAQDFVTPVSEVVKRPSRRAKTAALEKTKINLSQLLNDEDN